MNITAPSHSSLFLSSSPIQHTSKIKGNIITLNSRKRNGLSLVRASTGEGGTDGDEAKRRSFLTMEEAGLVEISGLSAHEKFLCRLTISSLNLLRVIAEQEECGIEELNGGKICDWFLKDKLKREQNFDSAVLQWDDSDFPF